MNNVKKNNKGFSLVELIVVVLIMAIIAVSLAPQVMKWVNNSRIATDRQTVDSVVSNLQIALTNSAAYSEVKDDADVQVTVNSAGVDFEDANDDLEAAFATVADASTLKLKTTGATVTITINKGVVVKPTYAVGDALYSADLDN